MIIIKIIGIFIGIILIWHFSTKYLIQKYRFYFYFGKKGCGKSTTLCKIAYENLKKGIQVYSTEDLSFKIYNKKTHKKEIKSTIPINPLYLSRYSFIPESVILIDEASLLWSNRDFKTMPKDTIKWFQEQRKHHVTVHLFSVSFDIDRKLREMCDEMYICQRFLRAWTICRHVVRKPVIVHPMGDSPSSIQDDIIEDGLLLAPFGGIKITFIPYWIKKFDSFKFQKDYTKSPAPIPPLPYQPSAASERYT